LAKINITDDGVSLAARAGSRCTVPDTVASPAKAGLATMLNPTLNKMAPSAMHRRREMVRIDKGCFILYILLK
jgi:hypothetical protein